MSNIFRIFSIGSTLLALLVPFASAQAALIDRVNEATRAAGAKVAVDRTAAFMHGIFVGHYTTFAQLVGAISWHKEQGTLPSFSTTAPIVSTQCITGNATSFAGSTTDGGSITVRGDIKTGEDSTFHVATRMLNLAANQYQVALGRGVGTGTNVKVCTADNFGSLYGHVTVTE